MPGPAPKPADQRRRRNAAPGSLLLPAEGRAGAAPEWPLSGKAPTVWFVLWRKPQAVAWERFHLEDVVARYALVRAQADKRVAHPTILAEARQLEDRLGLSPMAMLRLRWEITEAARETTPAGVTSLADYRDL